MFPKPRRLMSLARSPRARQALPVLALLATVVALDQTTKWWAWRQVSWTKINSGGDLLVGPRIGTLYSGPFTGAALDLLDFGLVTVAVWVLARCRVPAAVRVFGTLLTAGWGSNLLDRLGFHYWTAPGSVRGVVDWIHLGGYFYNVADFFIIGCTPLLLLAVLYQGVRAVVRPAAARSEPPPRARAGIPALAGAGLALVVALGAASYGVNAAPRTPPPQTTPTQTTPTQVRSRPSRPPHRPRAVCPRRDRHTAAPAPTGQPLPSTAR